MDWHLWQNNSSIFPEMNLGIMSHSQTYIFITRQMVELARAFVEKLKESPLRNLSLNETWTFITFSTVLCH
jgi:hypothetical protein